MFDYFLDELVYYINHGESCSLPFIMKKENKLILDVFSYFAIDDKLPITIFGFNRLLYFDGESFKFKHLKLFKTKSEFNEHFSNGRFCI